MGWHRIVTGCESRLEFPIATATVPELIGSENLKKCRKKNEQQLCKGLCTNGLKIL
jgi:hypothetical protein